MTLLNGSNKSLCADDAEVLINTIILPNNSNELSPKISVTALDLSNNIIERPLQSLPLSLKALDLSRNVLTNASKYLLLKTSLVI